MNCFWGGLINKERVYKKKASVCKDYYSGCFLFMY